MSKYNELKRLAEAATPQNFDSAEEKSENGYIECPHCGGQGEVERQVDYCNYDNVAIGVQFYGIGNEFGAAEDYYRAANPAAVVALIADFNAEHALRLAAERQVGELREQLAEHVKFLLHIKKCLVRNGEYSPLSHEELDTLAGINPCLNTTSTEGKDHG